MIFLNELKDAVLYKKPSYLPIDQKNKKTGSAVFLLTPNYDSSKKIMGSEMILQKYFESYFIEKDITYYINQENALVRRSDEVITEGFFNKPKPQKYKESELLENYKNVKKKLAEKKFIILDRNDPLHDVINSYKENYLWANDIPCKYLLYSDNKNGTFLPIMTFTDSFDPNNNHPFACYIGCKKNNVKNKVFLYCIYSEGEDKASIDDVIDIEFKYKNNTNESFIIEYANLPILESQYNQLYKSNVESFESGSSNVLFVTGVSGSGKSTMAREIAKRTDSIFVELDRFQFYGHIDKSSLIDKYYNSNPGLIKYTKYHWNNCSDDVFHSEFVKFFGWLMNQIKSNKNTKYVVEGIQLYKHIDPDVLKPYPIIIINKSLPKVYLQRIKRERDQYGASFKDILSGFTSISNLKDTINAMKNLRNFRKSINEDFHKDAELYRKQQGDSLVDVIIKMDLENLADKMDSFTEEEAIVQLLGSYKRKGYDTHLLMEFRDRYKNVLRWIRKKKDIIDPQEYIDYENNRLKNIPKSKIKEIEKKAISQQGNKPERFGVTESDLLLEGKNNTSNNCLPIPNLKNKDTHILAYNGHFAPVSTYLSRNFLNIFEWIKQDGAAIVSKDLLFGMTPNLLQLNAVDFIAWNYTPEKDDSGNQTMDISNFLSDYDLSLKSLKTGKYIWEKFPIYDVPIVAINNGTVVFDINLTEAGEFGPLAKILIEKVLPVNSIYTTGNVVCIKHDNTTYSLYAHLRGKKFKGILKSGTKVKKGEIIGHLGSTGNSMIPHLHFQIAYLPLPGIGGFVGGSKKETNFEPFYEQVIMEGSTLSNNIKNFLTLGLRDLYYNIFKVASVDFDYKVNNNGKIAYMSFIKNMKDSNSLSESQSIQQDNEYIIESGNSLGYMTQTFISNDMFLRCKLDGVQKYTKTVDIECIDELSVASKMDDKFKPIEKINVSKMRKIRLDENIINKYESEYRSLKHLRTSDDYTGYFYLYNNKPVGYINVNKVTNTIQAMEIFKDFQGMGLSEDLMKDWKALKGDNLTVNKDNNVAIAIYKKHGFRTYKTTDTMLFMKLPSSKIQQIKEFSDVMIVYPDCLEESYINEASGNANSILLRKLMYAERFRTPKEVFAIYDQVKADFPWISKTYLTYNKYLMYNMFIDLSFYNQTFFKNNIYKLDKGIDLYFDFINRFLNDARLLSAGYTNRTVIIPVNDWKSEGNIWMYNEDVNPISMITRLAMTTPEKFRDWAGINFVFTSDNAYFKIDFTTFDTKSVPLFLGLIKKLKNNEQPIDDPKDNTIDSKQAIVADIIDKIETSQKIKINNLTGSSGEITKDELVQKVTQAASVSTDVEQALDQLDKDEKLKGIIAALAMEEDNTIKLNAARTARMTHLNDEFLNKEINKKPIRDLLKEPKKDELLVTTLKIDSVNPEWQEMRYMNFEKSYDVDADIVKILMSFSEKSIPIAIRDISVTDESTAEDWIYTYNIQCEDGLGQRFTLKFDIPKIKDSKFMLLRGNEKTINGQLVQIPIMKTDEDTVQIVSNYNKIFVRRFGTTTGKSFVSADKIIKCLNKYQGKGITITRGDNSKISMKYDLPIDYIDIGSEFSIIETKNCIIYFSQDEIRSKYKIDDKKKGIPFGYSKDTKEVIYYNSEEPISDIISYHLTLDGDFRTLYTEAKPASKYTYSKASILNTEIPVIVVMGYTCGLIGALSKAGIEYQIEDKKPKDPTKDFIKFKDGYINYTLDYNSSLLMNGLKDCNTEDYLLADMNSKTMWLDFLDLFGGRIKADGLDNFTDLMIDPITDEVLDHYKLPVDYMELLAYANHLLEDNKFIKHTSTAGRRYRSNEIIAGYVYKALSEAYGDFKNKSKRISKGNTMTIKQSDVIDKILLDPTASDLSILNPLLEIESANAISYKGLSGMNSDRAYSLDKRTFDDSMLNVLALSTGFAGNVGITRQATVDMNIEGKRGYIKETKDKNNLSVTKTLCMTEALTPFGTTRDDPFRSAMTFIQTSKHGMRIRNSCPQLITNGADEALPYMISNTFAHKSKMAGKVVEKTDDYMILAYKDGSNEMVSLIDEVKKNSSGGFFTTIKLDTNLKEGSTFKENEIVAYDKLSFSNKIGSGANLSYNLGSLVKIAILNTDEGYEDSAIISDWLSSAMSSDVVVKKEITLPKNTNIYKMAEVGQAVQEGEPLVIFQNAFDDEDVNVLLKNLTGDEADISELGRISIKSKITGVVQDIKMYRTIEKDEMSDSLKKQFNKHEKPIKEYKKVIEKYKVANPVNLEPDYKLEPTGKLKNAKDSVLIEFYLKYEDNMSIGDKLIYYSALKGVIKDIFPVSKEPYSEFRKDETVHSLLAIGSVNGRMVCSVEVNALINKVLIELDRKVKDKLGIKFKMLDQM